MPIDDSDKPFPAPIPTIHNLPLRPRNQSQKLIDSDTGPQDLNNSLPTGDSKQKTNLKHVKGLILFLPNKIFMWKKLKEFAVLSFSLHESQSSMHSSPSGYKSYEIHVRMSWSITSIEYLQTNSNKQVPKPKQTAPVKSAPVPVLLQVNLIIPALLLRIIRFIDTAIRSSVFPTIWSTTKGFVNAIVSFIIVAVLWLLNGLRANSAYMESGLGGH
ncbi:hypothetical protein ASPWEDRAFT_37598 [Aspergillus wentii DTO 134E9]|uniref:Uncharacterized protein n=1 Tax=Aspergillus wentii DTO 134E9 TaxID=1073089 RepID=A0A1L9RY42_ASPWE|nr:uncharacterized protein ASPWEDRAFT_37598 [Aspergillus wentii DTO 134E9]OJJ39758.1 hypothetical protein ASPWEDRAFT_37598 [Aspergillus wentii DTO 134E9]